MMMLALAATVAHAQESSEVSEATQPAVALASPPTPASQSSPLVPSAGSSGGDGVRCLVDAYSTGGKPAIRDYQPPARSAAGGSETSPWEQAPYVSSVTHCGRFYIVQVLSMSKDPWAIGHARVEDGHGNVLRVDDLSFNPLKGRFGVNVIVAEAPPGANVPTLTLDLMGTDGRVAQIVVKETP
jgi:hypothetical protein